MGGQTGDACIGRSSESPRDLELGLGAVTSVMVRDCWESVRAHDVSGGGAFLEVVMNQMGKRPGRNCRLEFGVA